MNGCRGKKTEWGLTPQVHLFVSGEINGWGEKRKCVYVCSCVVAGVRCRRGRETDNKFFGLLVTNTFHT